MLLRGTSEITLSANNKLFIPERYRQQLINDYFIKNQELLYMLPVGKRCELIPSLEFKDYPIFEHAKYYNWDNDIANLLIDAFPVPATPWYQANSNKISVAQAQRKLNEEIKNLKGTRSGKGKQLESIVREILKDMGVIVTSNVRVLGSEIDILLCTFDHSGQLQYVMIELKYRESKANISQVLRLYGLQEALSKDVSIKNSLIANVSGYTKPAEAMIKRLNLSGLEIGQLFEWVDAHGLNHGNSALPFIKSLNFSKAGSIIIPAELKKNMGKSLMLVGMGNKFELLNKRLWTKQMAEDDMLEFDFPFSKFSL